MVYPLRGSANAPFTYLGQVMHSAAQASRVGGEPAGYMRGTLYSSPVFAIFGYSTGCCFAFAFARSLSAKVVLELSAGGGVQRVHCNEGLNIPGKYHHLELLPTSPCLCFIGILGASLRQDEKISGVEDVT